MHLPLFASSKLLISSLVALLVGTTLCAVDSKDLKKLKEGQCEGCDLKFAQLQGRELLGVNLFEANLQKANLVGSKLAGAVSNLAQSGRGRASSGGLGRPWQL